MICRTVIVFAMICTATASAAELYVSPTGDDANPGTREKPLATLAGARDAVRKLKQAGPLQQPVTVRVGGGTYFLAQAGRVQRSRIPARRLRRSLIWPSAARACV